MSRFGFIARNPKGYRLSSIPPTPPPDPGFLPYGDSVALVAGDAPYMVMIFNGATWTGYHACILNQYWLLTSAFAATHWLSTWTAKMGGVLADGSDATLSIPITGFTYHPSYLSPGDGNDIGLLYMAAGISSYSTEVQPIPYSAAVGTTPYDGEYFYPTDTIVGEQGLTHSVGGFFDSVNTEINGRNTIVLSNAAASGIFPVMDTESIATINGGKTDGAYGAPLICAGYTNGGYPGYFVVGPCSEPDLSGYQACKFTRCSHHGGWIYSETGIDSIIYP